MKITFFCSGVPNTFTGGGAITAFTIINTLRSRNHSVELLITTPRSSLETDLLFKNAIGDLDKHNISYSFFPNFRNNLSSGLPSWLRQFIVSYRERIWLLKYLIQDKPDFLLAYHWCALEKIFHLGRKWKIGGFVGDPLHLPGLFRREFLALKGAERLGFVSRIKLALEKSKLTFYSVPRVTRRMRAYLNSCSIAGAFAAHHADELSKLSNVKCEYFRTPTPDPLPQTFKQTELESFENKKFKLLMIGHLQGIATLTGVNFFVEEILPELSKVFSEDELEVRIAGRYFDTMPIDLQNKIHSNSSCRVLGHINPPHKEFVNCSAVLVPTPIDLGIRVRIVTAFSYGCAVVCHRSNSLGIPELTSGYNCFMGSSGKEIARSCRILHDHKELLGEIRKNSRQTYDQYFSQQIAGERIAESVERFLETD